MESYTIEVWELSKLTQRGTTGRWQADCGEKHARGETPEEAVSNLLSYIRDLHKADK